jgi:hypothetical protein
VEYPRVVHLLFIKDLIQITLFGNLGLFADDTALLYSEQKLIDEKQIEIECFEVQL